MPETRSIISRTRSLLFPPISPAFRNVSNTLKDDAHRAKGVIASAFTRPRPHPDVAAETDIATRFQVALATAGRTEADIPDIERSTGRRLELYVILSLVAALWMFLAPALGLSGVSGFHLLDLIFPAGFTAFLLAKAFAMNVALYRIQRRAMVPISEFLKDRSAWLGGKPGRTTTTILSALAMGVGLSAFYPYAALAQDAAVAASSAASSIGSGLAMLTATAGAEDLSLEWLRRLFPGMANIACSFASYSGAGVSTCTPSNADVLGAMMGAMNSALLGIGAFMMAWHTIVGTVATAHEGKVMGDRWHTIWAPIRVCLGFGMLVPIKGYCGIQFAVLLVIVMGYNMANGMWAVYVERALSGEMASLAVTMNPSLGLDLAHSIIASETCVALLEAQDTGIRAAQNAGGGRTLSFRAAVTMNPPIARPPIAGTPALGRDGQNGALVWSYGDICGSLRTAADSPPLNTATGATTLATTGSTTQAGLADEAVRAGNAAYETFLRARDRAIGTLITAIRNTQISQSVVTMVHPSGNAQAVAETNTAEQQIRTRYETIREAAATFETNINTAARTMTSVINSSGSVSFRQRAAALGWASAGALNTTLLRAAARASELTSAAAPRVSGPNMEAFTRASISRSQPPEVQQRLEAAMNVISRFISDLDQRGTATSQSVAIGADMQGRNMFAQLMKPVSDSITRGLTDGLGRIDPVRPMSSIQNMGNAMLFASQAAIGVYWGVRSISEGTATSILGQAGAGAARGLVEGVAPFFLMSIIPMLICGALHAYVLPMLPFIMWTFAILAVVSLAAELVIAAPLAAFMHLRMDGNELINESQRSIYLMTFNALLRPSMLLCGLVVANLVFAIMGNYLNKLYGVAVTTTNGDSVIGVVGFVTMTIMVFYMHYQLVVRSMQLISAVPSMVSELIGARDQDRDAHSEGTKIFGAVANITQRAGQATGNAVLSPNKATEPKPGGPNPGANAPGNSVAKAEKGDRGDRGEKGETPRTAAGPKPER